MLSQTEENYLKALFHLTSENANKHEVGTNELAATLAVKPATVNDMLKKLKEKKLINYEKYGKISLTTVGKKQAVEVVRKHRLWETFLYEKLQFSWDEVHEVAEQLEHIHSAKLIEQLEKFLGNPEYDPHGDAIPNAKGEFKIQARKTLSEIAVGKICKLVAVKDNSASFLQYVVQVGLGLSSKIKIISRQKFDGTMEIEVNKKKSIVSERFAENIYVI
ncbi:MAG: metal-dependent transcriptional regulator [Bacteroidetes bacterium]|nr:metal-dependent transcriptional regulator [Bacteroidota bacterium]MBS1670211.1 metal-dependent transcriptional regulator [Bacteroidota bacterium]